MFLVPSQITHFTFGEAVINSGYIPIILCIVIKGDLPVHILDQKPANMLHGVCISKKKKKKLSGRCCGCRKALIVYC